MKKLILLYFILSFFSYLTYSQYSLPFEEVNKNHIEKGTEGIIDSQCVGGLAYDDNTFENGYGWGPNFGIGKWVMLMTPASYPFTINQICLALTRYPTQPSLSFTFDFEIYDQTGTGGSPGNLLASIPNQTVTVVPTWPQIAWYDFTSLTGIPTITSGSVYVGISFDPQPVENRQKYIGADESTTTPLRPGYGYIQYAYPWTPIQDIFYYYRSIGIRCDGTSQAYAHNIGVGPFLSFPSSFSAGTQYSIKARINNFGTSNETGIPIKFFVNGAQLNSTTFNLNAGAVDSVSFSWTPSDSGNYTPAIVSALPTDEYRANDTVKTTVHVYPPGTYQLCVGTGAAAVGWPFYTFYMDSRTDMLYLSSELGFPASIIQRIGFDVISAAPQVMNGFQIKMKNTTNTTVTGFSSTGWTTVYTGTYSVPGTGVRWIDLQTPFVYNGTNLEVEICFDNTSYTSNTTVKSTTAANMCFHYHTDNNTGCTMTGTNSATSRPNLCVFTIVGNENQSNGVPKAFSLSQNYPNPFNPSTIIKYSIPKTSMVNLIIYDVLGRDVMTLVNDVMQPGEYNALFDASALSSGVYFCKIIAGDYNDTKKMLLVK